MDPLPRPVDVHALASEGVVVITWNDRHESRYELAYLRGHCPCAGCQGHGGTHTFREASGAAIELVGMETVGSYAIGLRFADGHDSGIYSYEHLLKICPCPLHGGPGYNPENLAGI
ncbi:MAG: DUF971 domain-containing protein [Deltaproteobacteria bacterium]|nr:DUF971 domain-containing protein [Deltaproteobacteria bacterium]